MRRIVLGTAGHVDHGKTTLVKALTGVDTDRLPEEKRRGISIELGFAAWQVDKETSASIVDVPGHRRLVHTMIAGASGIEAVLLVVAANEGAMPQTREHVEVCKLLGIAKMVLVISKIDLEELEMVDLVEQELIEWLTPDFDLEVVRVSSRNGIGVDQVGPAVLRLLAEAIPSSSEAPARLWIDRVFTVGGNGVVVTGTLSSGRIAVGDPLSIVGEGRMLAVSVRGLHVHDRAEKEAQSPTRLAIQVAGVELGELARGMLATSLPTPERGLFDAELTVVSPIRAGAPVDVHLGTARARGRIQYWSPPTETSPALVRIRLAGAGRAASSAGVAAGLQVFGGARFVLRSAARRGPNGGVVGGGRVIDAHPPKSRARSARVATLEAAASGAPDVLARALIAEAERGTGASPRWVDEKDLGERFPVSSAQISSALRTEASAGRSIHVAPGLHASPSVVDSVIEELVLAIGRHHQEAPTENGLSLETLRSQLSRRMAVELVNEAIRRAMEAAGEHRVEKIDHQVRLASFAKSKQADLALSTIQGELDSARAKGLSENRGAECSGVTAKEARAHLGRLVKEGVAIQSGGLWFSRAFTDQLITSVLAHFELHDKLDISAFKAISGVARTQAIPLLEFLDREGITSRKGDARTIGPRYRSKPLR